MTKEQIEKLKATRQTHPEYGRVLLARAAGVSEDQARAFMRSGKTQTGPGRPKSADKAATVDVVSFKKVKTLTDFRNTYDKGTIVPAKIKAGLKQLGAHGWEYESEFCRMAGVRLSDVAIFKESFSGYIVNLKDNRRAWAGSHATATAMREMI